MTIESLSLAISRRALVGGAVGLLAAPAILRAQQLFTAYPFRLGVAAGEPASDGFVIWTRLAPDPLGDHGGMPMQPVAVDWQVASDQRFATVVAKGSAIARPELAHAVHVEVAGLLPDRPYWYRFTVGRERSIAGRARTLPVAGAPLDHLRFGVAGCQNYEDGLFTAYRHLADEDVAFVYHYGDYIYEGRSSPVAMGYDGKPRRFVRAHEGQLLFDLADYRRRYAQYKMDPDLQAAHASAAWFATFDDHEVENNWVGETDQENDPPEVFALRRAAAFQAYYEHMPFRRASFPGPNGMQMYRRATVGNLVDLHLLDTRQFRSDQPCDDGFKPYCKGWDDPKAQVLGTRQEAWLDTALKQRSARWNALAQQVMVMPLDRRTGEEPAPIRNMDSWGGYDAPRERVLAKLAGLGNAVVLTGDEHQNYAGELRTKGGTGDAVAVEFVGTSISSGGDGADRRTGTERIIAGNPFLRYTNDRRGYLVCDVAHDQWQTRFRTVDRVSTPDATIKTAATATVEHGRPALSIA
ncbi:alkaline phosphatase D family protein [Sphingomonas faeni]|uniref:alkaline phosphatase D family protein n=1 Tax=Sphingomonas faeni TaxID=185950 RepID=UPI0020C82A20|nr:alkaline phosphatase D family protein [Sphingomonas faeni]MCP8890665.1 alkaline phosphatase D family protein [Sphingomonas faeni]